MMRSITRTIETDVGKITETYSSDSDFERFKEEAKKLGFGDKLEPERSAKPPRKLET